MKGMPLKLIKSIIIIIIIIIIIVWPKNVNIIARSCESGMNVRIRLREQERLEALSENRE